MNRSRREPSSWFSPRLPPSSFHVYPPSSFCSSAWATTCDVRVGAVGRAGAVPRPRRREVRRRARVRRWRRGVRRVRRRRAEVGPLSAGVCVAYMAPVQVRRPRRRGHLAVNSPAAAPLPTVVVNVNVVVDDTSVDVNVLPVPWSTIVAASVGFRAFRSAQHRGGQRNGGARRSRSRASR